ncbi:MAG: hypothetical protein U9P10_07390 [Thermodesulfobacteriota bacterium]|nr:hypothetical protein [Thermodesulfobacteriota bacterium]
MVVNDSESANPFYPCVHDEMCRGLAALGVGIVDMVVKGDLVPLFGHLKEVVGLEIMPDKSGLTKGGGPEIMGKLQLLKVVSPCPDKLLHNLEKHPGRILWQGTFCGVKDLVPQSPEGLEPVLFITPFQGLQKVYNRVCNTKPFGFGKLLDAKRGGKRDRRALLYIQGSCPGHRPY